MSTNQEQDIGAIISSNPHAAVYSTESQIDGDSDVLSTMDVTGKVDIGSNASLSSAAVKAGISLSRVDAIMLMQYVERCNSMKEIDSSAQKQLEMAITKFQEHYEQFATKNHLFMTKRNDVVLAMQNADCGHDVRMSARIFGNEIAKVLRVAEETQQISKAKWTGRLAEFLTKLYPLASFSLQLTSAIAGVTKTFEWTNHKGRKLFTAESGCRWIGDRPTGTSKFVLRR